MSAAVVHRITLQVTAHSGEELHRFAPGENLGFFLAKPVSLARLIDVMRDVLELGGGRAPVDAAVHRRG